MLITTSENIAGKKIVETLGITKGSTVRAKHIGQDIIANLKQFIGGEIKEYTEMIDQARDEATSRMIAQAKKMKADAIVCVRFGTADAMPGAAEVMVYGTAVRIK